MATIELIGLKGRRSIRLFRCTRDMQLVTDREISEGKCAGHTIMEAVILGPMEKLKLMFGLIS